MKGTKRLFVGLDLPRAIKDYLACSQNLELEGVRWTFHENFHLTLRFLGDVDGDAEGRILDRLKEIRVAPFTLSLGHAGVFPDRGDPRVLWMGLGTGHPLLFQLRQRVDDAILASNHPCEMRDFVPHVTLGRCSGLRHDSLRDFLNRSRTDEPGPIFNVSAFYLFESLRTSGGIRYIPVESFPFRRD